ncbi:MAG: class I SAM-dependent methyltransferase [Patescibacteria group bacterium]
MIRVIESCRSCGFKNLTQIFSLGNLYVSDFLDPGQEYQGTEAPLELVLCNQKDGGCGLLQLRHTVSGEVMYRNYWYKSGINQTMTDELNGIANKVSEIVGLKSGDLVIDIGANDGTLLRGYKIPGLKTVGFEPAKNLEEEGKKGTTKIIVDFFNHNSWEKEFGNAKAKSITAIAMFYDLDNPNIFVSDIVKCLDDDGILVIQMMYLPSFLGQNAVDGICHEHLEYYSLMALENLLARHGLEVFDLEMREHINEGSVRIYVRKKGLGKNLSVYDGAKQRVLAVREKEKSLGLDDKDIYERFAKRTIETKERVVSFIKQEIASGKKVHGYAASTKGNTTLQFYGLKPELIEAIADRNSLKWGKITVSTKIPVVSEIQSRSQKPDYYFVLAWHFLPEFREREKEFFKNGGKFIVPMPEFKIYET